MSITQTEINDLVRKFAEPLGSYVNSAARKESAEMLTKALWTALIAGPEMEEATWEILKTQGKLDDDLLEAIQQCYYEKMKPVVSEKQLAALRKRYDLRRRSET